ncbi:hypothetical protein EDD22DRAFT_930984 [Suillus occidentalis]|nr:hypothetical protein EDD22DRAFT_930984 [Suillus occidentalis]
MQQPSPAPNNITKNLSRGVSTTGPTHECDEPCGRDGTRDLPSQGSSEPSVQQRTVTNVVQSVSEHHVTEDITVSAMSVHASSNCLTASSIGCAHLDTSSQQSNKSPGMISVLPMHDGPCSPPTSCGIHDSLNCSCVSCVIASPLSNVGDSTAVVADGAVKKAISCDDDHPAPCARGTPEVKPRQDNCFKAEPTLISMTCNSNTVQTSSQTEDQDNPSCAADTRRCDARGSACVTVSKLSEDCRACTATTATDCSPLADKQLTQTATTDCAYESCSTDCLPTKLC